MITQHLFAQADAVRIPLATQSVDLVCGSPPYCDARTYGIDAQRDCAQWVDWMLSVTTEALRVARNCVIWVAAGVTRDRTYWPACEGLMWEWWKRGGSMYRPVYWHRVGIPGSGGNQWFRSDIEYCLCFKRPGSLPYSDNIACGHPPKFGPGGDMSNRLKDGSRSNPWGGGGTTAGRKVDGEKLTRKSIFSVSSRNPDALANPGNMLSTGAGGGGQLGWDGAHANEAPYPVDVPSFFIKSLTRPGDLILDPFSGSGTTVNAAVALGRRGIGFDLRMSQCKLGRMRLEDPHHPSVRRKPRREEPKTPSLFDSLLIGEDA